MSNLYELTNDYQYIVSLFEDSEVDPETLQGTLECIEAELEVKAEGYIKVIRTLEADRDALKKEADYYSNKAKTIDGNITRMKAALLQAMIKTGHDDKSGLKAGNFTLKVAGNGGQQPLKITGEVPDNYCKVTVEVDQKKIREAIAEGINLSFAELEPRGKHLAIK